MKPKHNNRDLLEFFTPKYTENPCLDDNIKELREQYKDGLHFVVGDTHGAYQTLEKLLAKIEFDPSKDHIYFVGDYNLGGNPWLLMDLLSRHYQEDYDAPGFHLIRGNHERELFPVFSLENMPDILVIRGRILNYYLAHAGMMRPAFDLINEDMAQNPDNSAYAYRLDESCAGYDAPLRQIVWSSRGLYSQRTRWHNWPSEEMLGEHKACIVHGHTPYCYFMGRSYSYGGSYGDVSMFWKHQHIFFSEDLQSFNIDSNMKGTYQNGQSYSGLACICLEVFDTVAEKNGGRLTVEGILREKNGVFSAAYELNRDTSYLGNYDKILKAAPKMKTITLGEDGNPVICE